MNKHLLLIILIISILPSLVAQVNFTANDVVTPYDGHFRAGSNFGLYPGFTDQMLGTLAGGQSELGVPGVGAKALRPGLFEHFTHEWGYDLRIPTFQHYIDIGLEDNTVIVGFPAEVHRDQSQYCPGVRSEMFANLYEPIWDNGENGTPVNENNYYATYLYNIVTRYGDYVRFYEIWNEPGFDYTGAEGWLESGQPGSWWDNDPNPCSYKLRAPIYHYVRTLRISWEIIKSLDPAAYIVVSGVGFPSFLDALLRNTDNPDQGNVSPDYPLRAGAYFDVLGMHSYPHFDGSLREWSNEIGWFRHFRHSDAAAQGLVRRKEMMQAVLDKYGYDGATFPKKLSTITECNVPRREFGEFIGGTVAQRNFIMKAVVTCMQNDIHQLHVFQISERTDYNEAQQEFDVMGLYKKIDPSLGLHQVPTEEGIALRTTTALLFGKRFDQDKTTALNLSENIGGGAFTDEGGETTYILWAKTTEDRNETSGTSYSFPNSLSINDLQIRNWNYTEGFQESSVSPTGIQLSATPIFLIEKSFDVNFLSSCVPGRVNFADNSSTAVSWEWTFAGGEPSFSTQSNPSVTYSEAGQYTARLIAKNAAGQIITSRETTVNISRVPQAQFSANLLGSGATFSSTNDPLTAQYLWEFGDGFTSTEANPSHTFAQNGTYEIKLTVSNNCGSTTTVQTVNITTQTTSRLTYTANDSVPDFPVFRPGVNLNYYPPWTDEQLADIAAGNPILGIRGAGLKTLRTQLPDEFFSFWGYDIRTNAFNYYDNLGLKENAVVVGYPSAQNRSREQYCPGNDSELFKNLYLDIWDDGEFGTPINDENDYARYLYETVQRYGDQTKFWEIWNAPDLTVNGDVGWREPGEPGNWWDNNPDPCSYKLFAPIQHYVRMLRISYEIIKTYDPDAFVTISGIAFPAFLDAICRNTDNPQDGSITSAYPLQGGAYFDAVGYVAFPHLDGSVRYYDHSIQTFRFTRHSDAAISSITHLKQQLEGVLEDYGYGANFPAKGMLVSRSNVPRRPRGDYLGGDDLQRNFLIKAYVEAVRNNLLRFNVYQIGETAYSGTETSELELMGLYEYLANVNVYDQRLTSGGIGFKTSADLLFGKVYDAARSIENDNYSIQAFRDQDDFYTYVAWAKTKNDFDESANLFYSFPASYDIDELELRRWDFGVNPAMTTISPNNVLLTGTPIFLTEIREVLPAPLAAFTTGIDNGCPDLSVDFVDISQHATSWEWTFTGGEPATSTEQNPTVVYPTSGTFPVTLKVSNEAGQNTVTEQDFIYIRTLPTAQFDVTQNGNRVTLINQSTNADGYFWSFGDGFTSMFENPTHDYLEDGFYAIQLIAENGGCIPDTFSQNIVIAENAVVAVFGADNPSGCPGLRVNFLNESVNAMRVEWLFPGGHPTTSDAMNPEVIYDSSGVFPVSLVAINGISRDTFTQENAVEVLNAALADFDYTVDRFTLTFNDLSSFAESYFWEFGDGTTSTESHPSHTFAPNSEYTVRLTVSNSLCGANTFERLISFAPPPIPRFIKEGDNGCPPLTVQFFDDSENATDWEWIFPGGIPATSTEQNPTVTYREPGSFSVTLDAGNASGSNAFTFANSVQVDTGAVADFIIEQDILDAATIQLTNESTFGQRYEWNFGDGTTSGNLNPSHTFADNGDYNIQLAAFNFNCGWDTLTKVVTISAPPIADFSFEIPTDCTAPQVPFMDNTRYSPLSYRWTFAGGVPYRSDEAHPVITYTSSGTYDVLLIVENEAGLDTITKSIVIQTNEYSDRTYAFCDNETLTIGQEVYDADDRFGTQVLVGQNGACNTTLALSFDILPTYQVSREVSIFAGESYLFGDQILTEAGKYQATLSTEAGCDSTVTLQLEVRTETEGLLDNGGRIADDGRRILETNETNIGLILQASPNPFQEKANLYFHLPTAAQVTVAVYDNHGRKLDILCANCHLEEGQQQVVWQPQKDLAKGIYWAQLKVDNNEIWKKIIWL